MSTIMTTYPLGADRVMIPIQQENLRCADRELIGGMTNGWFIIALTIKTLGLRLVLPDGSPCMDEQSSFWSHGLKDLVKPTWDDIIFQLFYW